MDDGWKWRREEGWRWINDDDDDDDIYIFTDDMERQAGGR